MKLKECSSFVFDEFMVYFLPTCIIGLTLITVPFPIQPGWTLLESPTGKKTYLENSHPKRDTTEIFWLDISNYQVAHTSQMLFESTSAPFL